MRMMQWIAAMMLMAGPVSAYTDAGFARKAADIGGLFDGTQAVEMKAFAEREDQAPAEVKAQPLAQVLVGVYVPVLPEGAEKTLESRVVELGLKYGFIWDKNYKPIVMNDSTERKPIWQGSFVYLVRGWINERMMGNMKEDPLVKGLWSDGRIGAASEEPGAQGKIGLFGPPREKDVFKEVEACRTVDVKFAKRPFLEDALKMLAPCMEALSSAYGAGIRAEADRVYTKPYVQGFQDGIALIVQGELADYRAVEDIESALAQRQGRVLTYRARVVNKAELRVSSLQSVVEECVKPRLVAPIKDAEDFVQAYRGCLEGAPELKIAGLYDVKERGRNRVLVISNAQRAVVEAMNGKVTVAGEQGPLEIEVRASKALRNQTR